MKLHIEIERRRELAGIQRRGQRRSHGVVEHGGEESALHIARRIEKLRLRLEVDLGRAALAIDRSKLDAQRFGAGRRWQPAIDHFPEEGVLVQWLLLMIPVIAR